MTWDEVGYVAGSLAASYLLGRSVSTPLWLYLADICGRRAVLSMCFMFSLVLTMFFGLCSTLPPAVLVRFCIGFFSPAYSLAQSILKELSTPCMEGLPSVSVLTTLTCLFTQAGALLVGCFMVPDISNLTTVQRFMYLSPSLVCAAATLFAFIAFFVDFPETLPLAMELRKKAKQASAQPVKKPAGKYVELAETGNPGTDEAKAETHGDVLTERKEHIDEDEDIPNYLMHFAQQKPEVLEEVPEEKDNLSKRLARFFSPRHADIPKVSLCPRPNTARANTFTYPPADLDEPKERIEERKSAFPTNSNTPEQRPPSDQEEIKRTHISFFEEDFDPAEMSGAGHVTLSTAPTLTDKFRRKTDGGVWSSPAFRSSILHSFLLTFLIEATRNATLIWLIAETPGLQLSVKALGLFLVLTCVGARLLQSVFMSRVVFYHPLNQYSIGSCVLLGLTVMALPYSDTVGKSIVAKLLAAGLMLLFEYLSSVLLTISVLKLSDSVAPELRESAMRWSAGLEGVSRAVGCLGGPALLAASFTGVIPIEYHWVYVGLGVGVLGLAAGMICDKQRFPRLNVYPYEV